jgi:hypothetical protein
MKKTFFILLALLQTSLLGYAAETYGSLPIKAMGTGALRTSPAPQTAVANSVRRAYPFLRKPQLQSSTLAPAQALTLPSLGGFPVVGPDTGSSFFAGLDSVDDFLTNNGGDPEPPDQGLAASDTQIMEAVNDVLAVYSTQGVALRFPTSLADFFHLDPSTHFLTDPRVIFDTDLNRWFVTLLEIDFDPVTGQLLQHSSVLIAASQTADATQGFNLAAIDVTDSGFLGCPCIGDQPLVGNNADGIYIATNQFAVAADGSVGPFQTALLTAIDKFALAAGKAFSAITIQGLSQGGAPAVSVQPAISLPGQTNLSDTEYFVSSLDPTGQGDNRLQVWSLQHTRTLPSKHPKLALVSTIIDTETYAIPPDAPQQDGFTPLRDLLNSIGANESLELLSTGDDRLQQVFFAGGMLYTGLTTAAIGSSGNPESAIAWWVLNPQSGKGTVSATVDSQGYIAVDNEAVLYPSFVVNSTGNGVIAFTLAGTDFFPGMAAVKFGSKASEQVVRLVAPGFAPEDGFSGYHFFGGSGSSRWGDYSAAAVSPSGTPWFATELILNHRRTVATNWSTAVGSIVF